MKRISVTPRANLATRVRDLGFEFARMDDGRLYWDEKAYYAFTLEQIERDIEAPTNELWAMCLDVAARAVADEAAMRRLGVPDFFQDAVAESWRTRQPTLYGRLDRAYTGQGPAKMLEFNADTPTSLYEAAVFQWQWLEDLRASGTLPGTADQFNSLHERLVERWRAIGRGTVHLACLDNTEDRVTTEYLADCAAQAGLRPTLLLMREIGKRANGFVDPAGKLIEQLFKLYPWEWLLRDEWGRSSALRHARLVEPAWKTLLSSKALLVELWRRFPGHPNLLPANFRDAITPGLGSEYVIKPVHGREGGNVIVVSGSKLLQQAGGPYTGPMIVQQRAALFQIPDGHAVLGSWIIGDRASGLGIREDGGLITSNTARFIPHAILG